MANIRAPDGNMYDYADYCENIKPQMKADMNTRRKKVLFIYRHNRTFIKDDYDILKKHYDVTPFFFSFKKIWSLYKELKKCDIVFIWFVSFHAWITAMLTKKPLVVVSGGYDVAKEKNIKYGLMLNPIYAHMVKYVLHKASKILAVSEFNKHEIEKNTGITDVDIVYNCIGHDKFVPKGKKENIVVTVGFVKKETWTRKGIYDFVKAAETFVDEDVRFVVAGRISKDIEKEVSKIKNVSFTGFLSDKKLLELYQKAKVVCQLSRYESFGIAPAEGMLCECVPVVTSDGALPEVVGNCGMYTCYVTSEIRRAIKAALSSDMGKRARQRIVETYPLERREKELVEILEAC